MSKPNTVYFEPFTVSEATTTANIPTDANIGPQPDGHVMSSPFFDVDSKAFYNAFRGKRKKKHWRTFLQNDENYTRIRDFARKHRNKPMYLRNRENQSEFFRVQ